MSNPIELDEIARHGAVMHGKSVARVVIVLDDGRKASFDLPRISEQAAEDKPAELTPTQQRILGVLASSPTPLTRRAIANLMERESTGGTFAVYIRDLVSSGLAIEQNGEISDEKTKFKRL